MTDSHLPPPPPPADPTAAEPPKKGSGKKAALIAAAVVILALVGGGAFAWSKLSSSGAQPHDVLPASSIAYARVDLDPSASQKIALLRLVRKFPEITKELGIESAQDDIRKLILAQPLKACGLDFDKDVKPWLGNRFGIALAKDGKSPIIAVQVNDEKKATRGFESFTNCSGSGTGTGPAIKYLDGYAIISEHQDVVDEAITETNDKPLAENASFKEDIKDLDGEGVASAWVDVKGLSQAAPQLFQQFAGGFLPGGELGLNVSADQTASPMDGIRSFAFSLKASSSTLELAGVGHSDEAIETQTNGMLNKLPDSTVFAFSLPGLGKSYSENADLTTEQLKQGLGLQTGMDPDVLLKQIEEATGLNIEQDLPTLLGDSLTFAIGSTNLENFTELRGPNDIAKFDIGIGFESDREKALDLAQRLAALVEQVGIKLEVAPTDNGAVIATNAETAQGFSSGDLGKNDKFADVIPHGDETAGGLFIDVKAITDALLAANPPADIRKGIEEAGVISSVGASGWKQSDHVNRFAFKVKFEK